jgi:hypothetical protein
MGVNKRKGIASGLHNLWYSQLDHPIKYIDNMGDLHIIPHGSLLPFCET